MYKKLVIMDSRKVEKSLRRWLETFRISPVNMGACIYFFHNILIGSLIIYAIIGPINWFYGFAVTVISALLPLHFFFRGCILIRLERYFWNDHKWKGLWTYLFAGCEKLGIEVTSGFENNTYIVLASSILLVVFIRLMA